MHSYYRNKLEKYNKQLFNYLSFIQPEIEQYFTDSYDKVINDVWKVYRDDILEKFPYIGDAKNVNNFTISYMLIAFGIVCTDNAISLDEWGKMTILVVERYIDKVPRILKFSIKHIIKMRTLTSWYLKKQSENNAKNVKENPMAFTTEVHPSTDQYLIRYYYTQCPLNEFAKLEGYTEYLPYICNIDYLTANKFGICLERHKTCSTGCDCCDFKVRANKQPHSYWPPHILDDTDELN